MSIISEQISTYFLCKGSWIPIPHCVLRSDKNKLNEKLGYCSVCWTNEAKENSYSPNPQPMNPGTFKQAGPDTL